ncbi:hypothetical protein RJ55_06081 [Drechmeria coniospora]|nr:hypothetical protein RJ55_06081 [Drechmeria coniospora]
MINIVIFLHKALTPSSQHQRRRNLGHRYDTLLTRSIMAPTAFHPLLLHRAFTYNCRKVINYRIMLLASCMQVTSASVDHTGPPGAACLNALLAGWDRMQMPKRPVPVPPLLLRASSKPRITGRKMCADFIPLLKGFTCGSECGVSARKHP